MVGCVLSPRSICDCSTVNNIHPRNVIPFVVAAQIGLLQYRHDVLSTNSAPASTLWMPKGDLADEPVLVTWHLALGKRLPRCRFTGAYVATCSSGINRIQCRKSKVVFDANVMRGVTTGCRAVT